MLRSRYLLLILLLLPVVSAVDARFYLANSTTDINFVVANSSYNSTQEYVDTTRPTNYTIYADTVLERDVTLDGYTFTGDGDAYSTNDSRCTYGECFVLTGVSGGGPTDEIATVEHTDTIDTSIGVWQFRVDYTNINLEGDDAFQIWLFDGTGYREVYEESGTPVYAVDNTTWTTENSTFTFELNSTFKHPTFKWFLRVEANTDIAGDDGVYVHAVTLQDNSSKTSSFPTFRQVDVGVGEIIERLNLSVHHTFSAQANVTYRIQIIDGDDLTVNEQWEQNVTVNVTDSNVNTSIFMGSAFADVGDIFALSFDVEHPSNFTGSLQFAQEQYPSHIFAVFIEGSINVTSFATDNTTFPLVLNVTVESSAPVDTVSLQRDGEDLGNMFLCTPTQYCFTDATASSENGTVWYQVTATNVLGFTTQENFSVQINPIRQVLVSTNFDDVFYADVNQTVEYVLYLSDTRGNIISDATPNMTFTTLGNTFNFTFDGVDERYETTLSFAVEGEYPFEISTGPTYYSFGTENLTGTTIVRNAYQVCFEAYTNVNTTSPYVNNLATLYAVDPNDQNILLKDLGFFEMWTEGGLGTFNVNVFHAPYIDGSACITLYNSTAQYQFYLVDGMISFKDNYDVPQVVDYGGLYMDFGKFAPTPNTTYGVQVSRAEYKYGKMLHNLLPMITLAIIVAMSVFVMIETGSFLAGFGVFLALFLMFVLFELWVWVFG